MSRTETADAATITWRHDWAPHLFSFRIARPQGLSFVAGQFVRLGVPGASGAIEWRAYSVASGPDADELEFYSIVVPDGAFTQALVRLGVGDTIQVDRTVYGFLRADRFTPADQLWLLATGTGIAPFVAMLSDDAVWKNHADIVVVHSVRTPPELAYRETIVREAARRGGARLHYVPTITGAPVDGMRTGRLTTGLADGSLEASVGLTIAPGASRLMLCGNPAMIKDGRALLRDKGLAPVRREQPGQFIVENFW